MLLFLYLTTAVAGFASPNKKGTRDADYLLSRRRSGCACSTTAGYSGRSCTCCSVPAIRRPCNAATPSYTQNTGDPHRTRFFVRTDPYK